MMVKNIGHKIAIARKKNNLTRVKLFQILQIPFLTLKKWEENEQIPNQDVITTLTRLFKLEEDFFFESLESNSPNSRLKKVVICKKKKGEKNNFLLKKWYHEDLFKNYNLQNFSFIDKVAFGKYCKIS